MSRFLWTGAMALWLTGCGTSGFPDAFDATLATAGDIVNDDALTPQQRRDRLAELGFTPDVINALMSGITNGNQFGGDLRSAFDKITTDQFAQLTPDEVQIWSDAIDDVGGESPSLTDSDAQAIVNLFVQVPINSADELSAFLDDPANEVPSAIPDDALQQLFIEFDPNELISELP